MSEKQLSDGGTDGTVLGQSASDLIAFFGATPAAQTSITALATGATITTVVTSVQQVIDRLKATGLFA
jgi:hypothetical protein